MGSDGLRGSSCVEDLSRPDPDTLEYISAANLPRMHKRVLGIENADKLQKLAVKLEKLEPKIPFHLWVEQPENVPVALASWPMRKFIVSKGFNGLRLLA